MWKTQMILTQIILSTMIDLLHADIWHHVKQEEFGGSFIRQQPPLVLSLGYGPIQETKPPSASLIGSQNLKQNQQLKGSFVIVQSSPRESFPFYRPFSRPNRTFRRPFPPVSFQNFNIGGRPPKWYPPSFPKGPPSSETSSKIPVTYIISEPQDFGYDLNLQHRPVERPDLGLTGDPPRIELFKSDSYTLPPDVTVYHPTDYAKDYFFDGSRTDSFKSSDESDKELLIGEEKKSNVDAEDDLETMVDGNTGFVLHNQYFPSNRKPLMFNEGQSSSPKNIYEVISAEKLAPENLEVTVENKSTLSWQPVNESTTENTVEATDVMKVEAIDGEKSVTESSVEENFEDVKSSEETMEKEATYSKTGNCDENINEDEENIDLRVEKLAERKSFRKRKNKINSRLDVVLIGQQICRK